MRPERWFLWQLALAACVQASSSDQPPADEPPLARTTEAERSARYHLFHKLDVSRAIEILLVRGKLEAARPLGRAIADTPSDAAEPWHRFSVRLQNEAAGVAYANTLEAGLRAAGRLAKVCAECHDATYPLPVFSPSPELPFDRPTPAARLERHVWASDRLWEGMISSADEPWLGALDVLATGPVPEVASAREELASRLQLLADQTRKQWRTDSHERRASRYSEILITCAGCHAH